MQLLVSSNELKDLIYDFVHFIFNLVKNPVIVPTMGKHAGIFQVDYVSRRLGLGKLKDALQVGYAHLAVLEYEVQNSESRLVRARLENLRAKNQIKVF